MKLRKFSLLTFSLCAIATVSSPAWGKDEPVSLEQCPAPVQAVIRQYSAQGTLEEIGLDENKKSGGPAVYEAKFTLAGGKRIEVHITATGSVIQVENKKSKE